MADQTEMLCTKGQGRNMQFSETQQTTIAVAVDGDGAETIGQLFTFHNVNLNDNKQKTEKKKVKKEKEQEKIKIRHSGRKTKQK